MKNKKLSKTQIQEEINKIFSKNPSPTEIKKAKRLAMSKNIKLGDLKKKLSAAEDYLILKDGELNSINDDINTSKAILQQKEEIYKHEKELLDKKR